VERVSDGTENRRRSRVRVFLIAGILPLSFYEEALMVLDESPRTTNRVLPVRRNS